MKKRLKFVAFYIQIFKHVVTVFLRLFMIFEFVITLIRDYVHSVANYGQSLWRSQSMLTYLRNSVLVMLVQLRLGQI